MPDVDEQYERLRRNIGSDFSRGKAGQSELYAFRCPACGYKNVHEVKSMKCGCGAELTGSLVYRKLGDTVVYDSRSGRPRKK